MKKLLLTMCVAALTFFAAGAQTTPDYSMIGYAAQEGSGATYHAGGTTGGAGGQTVTVSTFADLKKYAEDETTPYIILIDGEITTGNPCWVISASGELVSETTSGAELSTYGEVISLGSNKTLLGLGDGAFLNRIGLNANVKSNIIIRNIKFSFKAVPTSRDGEMKVIALRNGVETLVGDPDCISFQADKTSAKTDYSHHFWVDHCEFYNGGADEKDRYDGLLDMKNNVQHVTISWCHFHDHDKACLSGKGNSDDYPRTVTMHHNYFENIEGSRLPLQRGGYYHYFNNYMNNCQDGYDLRAKAQSYIEGCYFKDTKSPVMPSGEGEGATLVDCIFDNCKRIPSEYAVDGQKYDQLYTIPTSTYRPDYEYAAYLDAASDVPNIVPLYVGVGKIDDENVIGKKPGIVFNSPTANEIFSYEEGNTVNVTIDAQVTDEDGTVSSVEFLLDNVSVATFTQAPYTYTAEAVADGSHTVLVKATDNDGNLSSRSISFSVAKHTDPVDPVDPSDPSGEPISGMFTIDATSVLPAGVSLDFTREAYIYSDAKDFNMIAFTAAGTYNITLPSGVTVTKIEVTHCCDNNTAEKGTMTIAGKTEKQPSRKTPGVFTVDNLAMTGNVEFTMTYKGAAKFTFYPLANSLDQTTGKEIVASEYFTIDGRRAADVENGLYIVRRIYNDGSVKVSREIVR